MWSVSALQLLCWIRLYSTSRRPQYCFRGFKYKILKSWKVRASIVRVGISRNPFLLLAKFQLSSASRSISGLCVVWSVSHYTTAEEFLCSLIHL